MKQDTWRRDPAAYALQGTLQPRFTDVDMWQHINNVAQIGLHGEVLQQWLRATLDQALAAAPADCSQLATVNQAIGDGCKACHRDFKN